MKAIINKRNRGWFLAIVFMLPGIAAVAQTPHVTCSLQNCSSNAPNTLEFDLYIVNDGAASLKLNSLSYGININTGILVSTSDVLKFAYTGVSDLPSSITGTFSLMYSDKVHQLKLVSLPSAVSYQSALSLAPNTPVKVGHFLVTNTTHSWVPGSTTNFTLNTTPAMRVSNTGAVAYVNTAKIVSNFNTPVNRSASVACSTTLNRCSAMAADTLTGSTATYFSNTGTITLSSSQPGVSYQLYNSSNAPVQPSKSGTGSQLVWTNVAVGNGYYVVATNTGGCNSKTGTANVTASSALRINVRPLPSQTNFTLAVQSSSQETIEINIYDVVGRKVQQLRGSPGDIYQFGDTFAGGAYFVEVLQGSQRATQKILKQ